MPGTDRYTDALAELRTAGASTTDQRIAHAQVHATLALAAATALKVVLPLVGNDHDEVNQWARLLLPGFSRGRSYTEAEWNEILTEDAPSLPLTVTRDLQVHTCRTSGGERLNLRIGHPTTGFANEALNPEQAGRLGLALLAWSQRSTTGSDVLPAETLPECWPPRHGDTWADRDGDYWLCESLGQTFMPHLVCKAYTADDSADEIRRTRGPMRLVSRLGVRDDEVPF